MEEILAMLLALTAPEPDSAYFEALLAGGDPPRVVTTPCRDPIARTEIVGETLLCGIVTVPEDHDAPDNGQEVELAFAILRAQTMFPEPDPVVYLHGGPGIGSLNGGLATMAQFFAPFRATRDVVLFDQRAAGISSGSVVCTEHLTQNISQVILQETAAIEADESGTIVASAFLRDCLAEIEASGTDLSRYNTRQNALDVPMILSSLGYETWNLYGISYGTKLTLEVMRTAPQGTRAVVIDGVAPPWIRLYDTLALPMAESMQRLVDDCAAEPACDAAYPDLGGVLRDVIAQATAGTLIVDGEAVPPQLITEIFSQRNTFHHPRSFTPYLPAMIYELHRGGDTPTLEMVIEDWSFDVPPLDPAGLLAARAEALTEQQQHLLSLAAMNAEMIGNATRSLDIAIGDLRRQLRRDRELGPLPGLFDAELSAAARDGITTSEAARALLVSYSALQSGRRTRGRLSDFVEAHFPGPHLSRLMAIVDAMTEGEINAVYDYVALEVQTHTLDFQQNSIDLMLYACQEDLPFNSREGYDETTAAQPFDVSAKYAGAALYVYATCEAFEPAERENWHTVVESDIPTISIGSGWDVQTAASWAEEATRGLSNAQHFFIAEAGHGALAYVDCVGDMTAAFFNDPSRVFDDSCERAAAVPPFHIAPWVEQPAEDAAP